MAKKKPTALDMPVLVLDVETRKSSHDVGGWKYKEAMGISVAIVYNPETDAYTHFKEEEIGKLMLLLVSGPCIVGFNLIDFDFHVLKGAMQRAHILPVAIAHLRNMPPAEWPTEFRVVDLMKYIQQDAGHKISLAALVQATLREEKSGDGLTAVQLWNQGKLDELAAYCIRDCELTYKLYRWGLEKGTYWWFTRQGKVKWGKALWQDAVESYARR